MTVYCAPTATQAGSTFNATSGAGNFQCTFPDGPASSIVSVQVKDSDNANSNTATQTVTIANVAPTVRLSATNDLLVNEGTQHTYSYTVSDPGIDTFSVVSVSCVPPHSRPTSTTVRRQLAAPSPRPNSSRSRCRSRTPTTPTATRATQTVTVANLLDRILSAPITCRPTRRATLQFPDDPAPTVSVSRTWSRGTVARRQTASGGRLSAPSPTAEHEHRLGQVKDS